MLCPIFTGCPFASLATNCVVSALHDFGLMAGATGRCIISIQTFAIKDLSPKQVSYPVPDPGLDKYPVENQIINI